MILSVNELHKLTVYIVISYGCFGERQLNIGEISVFVIHYYIVVFRIAALQKIVPDFYRQRW